MVRPGVPDGNDPNNPVRVYADGVFDMYHVGHAKVLKQAKMLFKHVYLIVGVSGDEETIAKKGKIVMNQEERSEILKHCKWVDEVICPCPWIVTVEFMKQHNIHYVAHDDLPYGSVGQEDIYYEVKRQGMFRATQRTEGISTSDVILRIIKDYDMYIERSLERGYNRQEIGISATKIFRVKLRSKIQKMMQDTKIKNKKGLLGIFQDLEYQTESLWHEFANQFGKKLKKEKKEDKEPLTLCYYDSLNEEIPDDNESSLKSFWQNLYKKILNTFSLDKTVIDGEEILDNDVIPLNKRTQKALRKK